MHMQKTASKVSTSNPQPQKNAKKNRIKKKEMINCCRVKKNEKTSYKKFKKQVTT